MSKVSVREVFENEVKLAFFGNVDAQNFLIDLSRLANATTKEAAVESVKGFDKLTLSLMKLASYGHEDAKEFFKEAKEILKGLELTKESFVFPEAVLNPGTDTAVNALIGGASGGAAGNVLTKDNEDMKKRQENTIKGLLLGTGLGGLGTLITKESV